MKFPELKNKNLPSLKTYGDRHSTLETIAFILALLNFTRCHWRIISKVYYCEMYADSCEMLKSYQETGFYTHYMPLLVSLSVHIFLLYGIMTKKHRALKPWLMLGLPIIVVSTQRRKSIHTFALL